MPTARRGNTNSTKRAKDDSAGPWERTRVKTRHGRAIAFIEKYCRAPKGVGYGKPLRLANWQKEWLEEILADDVSVAAMSLPRGQGKSTFAAGLATWAVFDDHEYGAPVVPIIATRVEQAKRSVYSVVSSMVAHEPELESRSIPYTAIGATKLLVPRTEGTVFPMSSDVDGLQGLDISLAIADEIGFISPESWSSLMMAGGKRPHSLVLGLGTPGVDHDNALWEIRQRVIEGKELRRFRYKEYSADLSSPIDDENEWRRANPSIDEGFLDIEALRSDRDNNPESFFRIFRLGQWYEGYENWLGADGKLIWDDLEDPYEFIEGAPTWVGVDAAIKRDTTAVVAVQYRDDGRLHAKAKIWTPQKDEPVDITDVMAYLRTLCTQYRVGAVSFDSRFMDVPAKTLYDEGIPMTEVPQSNTRMTPIIGDLYELILTGQLSHDKDDLFTSHVLNAIPKMQENGFTLSKGKSRGHIDGVIALSLAVDRARHKTKPRPKVVVL